MRYKLERVQLGYLLMESQRLTRCILAIHKFSILILLCVLLMFKSLKPFHMHCSITVKLKVALLLNTDYHLQNKPDNKIVCYYFTKAGSSVQNDMLFWRRLFHRVTINWKQLGSSELTYNIQSCMANK